MFSMKVTVLSNRRKTNRFAFLPRRLGSPDRPYKSVCVHGADFLAIRNGSPQFHAPVPPRAAHRQARRAPSRK